MMVPTSDQDMEISRYVSRSISNDTGWFDTDHYGPNEYTGKRMYVGGATITLYEIVDPVEIEKIESISKEAIETIGGNVSLFFYEKQNMVVSKNGSASRGKEKMIHKSVFNSTKR